MGSLGLFFNNVSDLAGLQDVWRALLNSGEPTADKDHEQPLQTEQSTQAHAAGVFDCTSAYWDDIFTNHTEIPDTASFFEGLIDYAQAKGSDPYSLVFCYIVREETFDVSFDEGLFLPTTAVHPDESPKCAESQQVKDLHS